MITAPEILDIVPISTVPSSKTTLISGVSDIEGINVSEEASIVIVVVVADITRPPLLAPALTGSLISITAPGLTTTPASIEVEKVTVSDSFCSAKRIARPNLCA